jgi:Gluconate 2-dehydrogenase subunit 3
MNRRDAIKKAAVMFGGSLLMPDVLKAWTHPMIENPNFRLTTAQDALIAEIAETIVPTTDTPGAKAAGVPNFIKKMLADCYRESYSNYFMKELDAVEADTKAKFSKSFVDASTEERTEILKMYEKKAKTEAAKFREEAQSWGQSTLPSERPFFATMKDLTVTGYFTSEIGCTQALRYEAVPMKYIPDYPYKKGDKAWAT